MLLFFAMPEVLCISNKKHDYFLRNTKIYKKKIKKILHCCFWIGFNLQSKCCKQNIFSWEYSFFFLSMREKRQQKHGELIHIHDFSDASLENISSCLKISELTSSRHCHALATLALYVNHVTFLFILMNKV